MPVEITVHQLYIVYVVEWFSEHEEGEPACFSEWFHNEYQELLKLNQKENND